MAVVSAIKAKTQSKTATGKVIAYVIHKKKTLFHDTETDQKYRLISGQNCVAETAFKEFMATKIQYGKDNGVFYKHFVQSFKPGEAATPKEIHQMGIELAEYFKGFEVVIATHIDADHWHNHLIINSVNAETGLKIQFSERNLNQLRRQSDEICQAHGLTVLKTYQKETPVAGINTREYRAAERGNSWKFKLISAIDMAMAESRTKADFIANMERMGYGVKWIDHYKYITYTTPEGQKCRDNRLHEEKYLKERMEQFYEFGQTQNLEQAGQSVNAEGKFDGRIQSEAAILRNPPGGSGKAGADDNRSGQVPSTHARQNRPSAHMGGLDTGHHAGSENGNEQPHRGRESVREQLAAGISESGGAAAEQPVGFDGQENQWAGADLDRTGQHAVQAAPEMDGDWSGIAGAVVGAAVAIEALLVNDQPKEKESKKQVVERKNRQKKKQSREQDWEMSL